MPFRELADLIPDRPKKMNAGEDAAASYGTGLMEGVTGAMSAVPDLKAFLGGVVDKGVEVARSKGLNLPEAPKPRQKIPTPGTVFQTLTSAAAKGMGIDPTIARFVVGAGNPVMAAEGPTSPEVLAALRQGKPAHEPQTKAGEYLRTAGQFTPAGVSPGSLPRKVAQVVVPAVASETAGQMTDGTALEPYARVAGALVGGVGAGLAARPRPTTRMLADASRAATDDQIATARALREDAARRGITLTQAEALQQVTENATGMGRMQRVIEGTTPGGEIIDPIMSQRPGQVRQAVSQYADNLAPPTANPYTLGQQAQEAAGGVLNKTRQDINAQAKPFYDRLPGQSLPEDAYAQLAADPSYAKALEEIRGNPELAPLLQADLPLDPAARMTRARQQGFNPDETLYHGTTQAVEGPFIPSPDGPGGPGVYTSASRTQAHNYANPNNRPGDAPNIMPLIAREGAAEQVGQSAARVIRNPDDLRSTFDQFPPPNPDNDLNVINRAVQQLDQMKEAATPSAVNPQGSHTLAARRAEARALADQLASEASDDWRQARETVAQGRAERLEPLQRGPVGAISNTDDVRAQTSALFPNAPPEGAAGPTGQAMQMLPPDVSSGLARQHVVNTMNETTQNLVGGPNQWAGGKFAATIAGNPEQRRTLLAGIEGAGGDRGDLEGLLAALEATGKRQAPGSRTAYNTEDLRRLGEAGAVGEGVKAIASGPSMFRRFGEGLQDWQTSRNARDLARALTADPAQAEQILLEARRLSPPSASQDEVVRLAMILGQARISAQQPQAAQ